MKVFDVSVKEAIRCSGLHFLSSGLVGLLVYWLTSTTLYHLNLEISQFGVEGVYIDRLPLYVALCCSVLFHILEDRYLAAF